MIIQLELGTRHREETETKTNTKRKAKDGGWDEEGVHRLPKLWLIIKGASRLEGSEWGNENNIITNAAGNLIGIQKDTQTRTHNASYACCSAWLCAYSAVCDRIQSSPDERRLFLFQFLWSPKERQRERESAHREEKEKKKVTTLRQKQPRFHSIRPDGDLIFLYRTLDYNHSSNINNNNKRVESTWSREPVALSYSWLCSVSSNPLKNENKSAWGTKQLSSFPLPGQKGRKKSKVEKTVSLVVNHYNLQMKLDPRQVSSFYCRASVAQKRIYNNNNNSYSNLRDLPSLAVSCSVLKRISTFKFWKLNRVLLPLLNSLLHQHHKNNNKKKRWKTNK